MNKRIQKYKEKAYGSSFDTTSFIPPLNISTSLVSRWGPDDGFSSTKRKHLSFSIITMGNGNYEQNSESGSVNKGEIFIAHLEKNQKLFTGSEGFLHKRSIILSGSEIGTLIQSTGLFEHSVITPLDSSAMIKLFRDAYNLMRFRNENMVVRLSEIAYKIILLCAESISQQHPAEIKTAVKFINNNINTNISLKDIATSISVSVRQLNRLFNDCFNISPVAFLLKQKMIYAEKMVCNTSISFKEIAYGLGYENPLYFSSQFKNYFGASPQLYRKNYMGA